MIVLVPDSVLTVWDPVVGTQLSYNVLYASDDTPVLITWDKRFIWAAKSRAISSWDIGTGTPRQLSLQTMDHTPNAGVFHDKRFVWTLNRTGALRRVDPAKAANRLSVFTLSGSFRDLTGDGNSLWTINLTSGNIEQYDSVTGTLKGGFAHPTDALGLHYDGRFLWVIAGTGLGQGIIYQYDPVTGTSTYNFNTRLYPTTAGGPLSLTGNGRFLYATELV